MMKRWGSHEVSSALEICIILAHPPNDRARYDAWEDLLEIEPPVWGSDEAQTSAAVLASRGYKVWSWDDYGVVYSPIGVTPPRGVDYRSWHTLGLRNAS